MSKQKNENDDDDDTSEYLPSELLLIILRYNNPMAMWNRLRKISKETNVAMTSQYIVSQIPFKFIYKWAPILVIDKSETAPIFSSWVQHIQTLEIYMDFSNRKVLKITKDKRYSLGFHGFFMPFHDLKNLTLIGCDTEWPLLLEGWQTKVLDTVILCGTEYLQTSPSVRTLEIRNIPSCSYLHDTQYSWKSEYIFYDEIPKLLHITNSWGGPLKIPKIHVRIRYNSNTPNRYKNRRLTIEFTKHGGEFDLQTVRETTPTLGDIAFDHIKYRRTMIQIDQWSVNRIECDECYFCIEKPLYVRHIIIRKLAKRRYEVPRFTEHRHFDTLERVVMMWYEDPSKGYHKMIETITFDNVDMLDDTLSHQLDTLGIKYNVPKN